MFEALRSDRLVELRTDATGGTVDIAGCSAVISGGASGLGLATARRLSAARASVVLLDLPSSAGSGLAAEIGNRATFVAADVTDETQVSAALDQADRLGPVRIAVACAGIAPPARVLGGNGVVPLEHFAKTISVNLVGTFNLVRLAAERVAAQDLVGEERGVLVCTASAAAYDGQIGQAAYAASKGGIVGMTLPLARDLADKAIRVVSVAPGLFDTALMAGLPEDTRASLARQVPHPSRLGDPAEFAALVQHIVENPMLNGEVIRLDGAIRMAPR
jgi:NAD(P)-dependent dehydrogenase (short-subunit alcohol dehydrogenase family)